jgi:hypothetical protein
MLDVLSIVDREAHLMRDAACSFSRLSRLFGKA